MTNTRHVTASARPAAEQGETGSVGSFYSSRTLGIRGTGAVSHRHENGRHDDMRNYAGGDLSTMNGEEGQHHEFLDDVRADEHVKFTRAVLSPSACL